MSTTQVRVLTVALVTLVVLTAFLIYRNSLARREALLFSVEFEIGTPRAEVVATLGTPDQQFTRAEFEKYGVAPEPACFRATKALRYFSPGRGGGPSAAVYLDANDRVVCVEHGMIAI